ncbi:hypothetical protein, partial [Sphingomonas sp.]|uniref:hypothetical protein n=1 Tax=Sphingomonas sp. TaxID=28214 RepID=UPI00257ABE88
VARESSRVEAWGSSRVEAWGYSRVEARGSSSVEARGYSSVVARESSRVVARGYSSVVAWESSSVVAWGSSRVEAWGYSMLQARGRYVTAKAAATVCVNLWEDAKCDGGRQQVIEMTTPQNWCDYYGVRVEDGCAIVYKAVGEGYVSHWGVAYKPGTMPTDGKWDGRKRECSAGGGLNFSPTVDHTHEFVNAPKHYLECRIRLDDMVVHFGGSYPQKCCAREVVAPLIEVDRDGKPITA